MASSEISAPREWTVGHSVFRALPGEGARLLSWHRAGRPVIRWPEVVDTPLTKVRGGNPILFPFAGRTFADGVEGQWRWANTLRPMPRHGFARAGAFEVVDDETGFTATLQPTDDDLLAYPFHFTFHVTYRFEPDAVTVDFVLRNDGDKPAPWSAGHHFYFDLPVADRAGCTLEIPAERAWYHGADGQLVEAQPPVDGQARFDDPALVDRIHTHLNTPHVRFGPVPGADRLIISADGGAGAWTAFVVWTEADDSPFYCVEPWMGPPNGPGHELGLCTVAAGTTGRFSVRLEAQ